MSINYRGNKVDMEGKRMITNLTYLREASNNNEEFVQEMIQIFLRQTPAYLDEIFLNVEKKQWDDVKRILHKLKPTLPMMGIAGGEDLVRSIEDDVKSGNYQLEIIPRLTKIKALCEMAYAELKDSTE